MSIWDRFLYLIGLRTTPGPRTYHFDANESLQVTLSTLATDEGRPENDLIPDILSAGLTQYISNERLWTRWESLSTREKDVAALTCLGYTNREIAARLSIAPDTVKSRLHNVMRKFNLHKRSDLRVLFAHWDFSEWQRREIWTLCFITPEI
jgi:DNA-binding CsgD family transcriptional regulator